MNFIKLKEFDKVVKEKFNDSFDNEVVTGFDIYLNKYHITKFHETTIYSATVRKSTAVVIITLNNGEAVKVLDPIEEILEKLSPNP